MTSLIFGSIYLAHKGVIEHRHEKQRVKNYQRWEDLRDEYDAQKKITRGSRSLDIQRTGNGYGQEDQHHSAGIFTLRDQQEANDARTSWRPQESWEHSHHDNQNSHVGVNTARPGYDESQFSPNQQRKGSVPSAYWASRGELRPQKTGMTWDEGLPAPLKVARRSYDDYDQSVRNGSVGRTNSVVGTDSPLRQSSTQTTPISTRPHSRESSRPPAPIQTQTQSQALPLYPAPMTAVTSLFEGLDQPLYSAPAKIASFTVEPVHSHVPGGRMAELIERGY